MTFEINEQVSAEQLCSLRESVGWNRMEKEFSKDKQCDDKEICPRMVKSAVNILESII